MVLSLLITKVDRTTTKGTKARLIRVNSQFRKTNILVTAAARTTTSRDRTRPRLTYRRTASTSEVALDMRLPVCSLSW